MQSFYEGRNHIQEWVDRFIALVIMSMLAEQLFQLRGQLSWYLILLLGLVCILTLRGIYFQRGLWILILSGGFYALTAYFTGRGYSVVRNDLFNIFQGAVISGFVGLSHFDPGRRARFWLFLHRGIAITGAIAGWLGLVKLVLLSRGVQLSYFFTDEGYYPPGSSLNGDYNLFSLGMVLSMGSTVWVSHRIPSYFWYLFCQIALPGMIVATLLTSSRRALVFLALGVVLLIVTGAIRRRQQAKQAPVQGRRHRGSWIIGAVYVALGFVIILNHESLFERLTSFFMEDEVQAVTERSRTLGSEESIAGRTIYWQAAERLLTDSGPMQWIAGSGFSYVGEMASIGGVEEDYPHNFLLSSMLYGGVSQTGLTLVMLGVLLRNTWRAGPEHRVVTFWIALFIMFHLTSSNSIFSTEFFVACMVLGLDMVRERPPSGPSRGVIASSLLSRPHNCSDKRGQRLI